ncbi:MAG: hypothetical protein ACLRMZ_07590 [Blautia marasmi]
METAIFQLEDGRTSADVTRSLFETAHDYVEGFSVFGDKMSFEWNFENEDPYVYAFEEGMAETNIGNRGRMISRQAVHCPNEKNFCRKRSESIPRSLLSWIRITLKCI